MEMVLEIGELFLTNGERINADIVSRERFQRFFQDRTSIRGAILITPCHDAITTTYYSSAA